MERRAKTLLECRTITEQTSLCSAIYLPRMTTWHCPHLPAAAAAIDRYLLPVEPTAANL